MAEDDDDRKVTVERVTAGGLSVWQGEGVDVDSGDRILFHGDPRQMAVIAEAIEAGESPVASVPDWAVSLRVPASAPAEPGPRVGSVWRRLGVAGQISYSAEVTYPGEDPATITFVGSVYGGPVVMVTPAGVQTFVSNPDRFGTFGPDWVRRFFQEGSQ